MYPLLTPKQIENFKHYNVARCYDGFNFTFNRNLEEGYSYRVAFERVNAISVNLNNDVRINCKILDAESIPYVIYKNTTLAEIGSLSYSQFGTSLSGSYTFNIEINTNDGGVPYVNLALAVILEGKISDLINSTDSDPIDTNSTIPNNSTIPDNNQTTHNVIFSIPPEGLLVIGVICVAGIGLVIIFITTYRKKN
jgi:hypothetical protein